MAVLSTGAGGPHAIPVSTAVRVGPRTVVFALALRRESLARLREDARCALTVITGGDVALTAYGRATIVEEPMAVSDRVAAVRIDVEAHPGPRPGQLRDRRRRGVALDRPGGRAARP